MSERNMRIKATLTLDDVVSVAGDFDRDFFEGRELEARSIVTPFDHPG